jgi:hypothetical protein
MTDSANRSAEPCIRPDMNLSRTLSTAALAAAILAVSMAPTTLAQAAESPAERATKKPHVVTAKANKTEVVQGGKVVITGRVKPAAAGEKVRLQVRYAGAWKATDLQDKVDKQGRFRLVDKVTSKQDREYRVLARADRKHRAGLSDALPVVVWSWRDLSSLAPVRREATDEAYQVAVNGTTHRSAIVATGGNAGGTDYNVSRKCRQLETQVGLADYSKTGTTGTVSLKADGVSRYTGSFGLAQSATVVLPLRDVFRISFDWTSVNPAGTPADQSGAYPALGSPQVLCRD